MQIPIARPLSRRRMLHYSITALGTTLLTSNHFQVFAQLTPQGKEQAKTAPAKFLRGEALYSDVLAYCGLGEHRTNKEHIKTSEWLAEELDRAGLKTDFRPFTVQQFFLDKVNLEVDGKAVEVFPLWPPRATGPIPIQARLAQATIESSSGKLSASLKGSIALAHFGPPSVRLQPERLIAEVVAAGAIAVIAIYETVSGDLFAHNLHQSLPVPVVVAGTKDETALNHAARRGAPVTLQIEGREEPGPGSKRCSGRLEKGKTSHRDFDTL